MISGTYWTLTADLSPHWPIWGSGSAWPHGGRRLSGSLCLSYLQDGPEQVLCQTQRGPWSPHIGSPGGDAKPVSTHVPRCWSAPQSRQLGLRWKPKARAPWEASRGPADGHPPAGLSRVLVWAQAEPDVFFLQGHVTWEEGSTPLTHRPQPPRQRPNLQTWPHAQVQGPASA